MPRTRAWGRSLPGRGRDHNEDSFWFCGGHSIGALVVADGVGGQPAGEVASHATMRGFMTGASSALAAKRSCGDALARGAELAHEFVRRAVAADPVGRTGACSTLVGCCVAGSEARVIHAGDSACFLVRDGAWKSLARPHNDRLGHLTACITGSPPAGQVGGQDRAGQLPRGFYYGAELGPPIEVRPGDLIVLASDGLTRYFNRGPENAPEWARRAARTSQGPQEITRRLVQLAVERGGEDDVTVVVAEVIA